MQLSHHERRINRPRTVVSGKADSFFIFLHLVHVFFIGRLLSNMGDFAGSIPPFIKIRPRQIVKISKAKLREMSIPHTSAPVPPASARNSRFRRLRASRLASPPTTGRQYPDAPTAPRRRTPRETS